MNRQFLFLFLIVLCTSSCQQKDTTTTVTPPIDSPKAFLPYSVDYAGSMHNNHNDESSYFAPEFDTTYHEVLAVQYPDTLHINFRLAFWDVKRDGNPKYDTLYYNKKDYNFLRSPSSTYLDSARHNKIRFTIRGDSLLVDKFEYAGCCPGFQAVSFAGKRQ